MPIKDDREPREHAAAADLLRALAGGTHPWSIPWPCVYEFFSVVTNARIWKQAASTPAQAWAQLRAWMGSPSLALLAETEGFSETLAELALRPRVRGPVIHDARAAAICLAHGLDELLGRDRDFALFPELCVRDPFAAR